MCYPKPGPRCSTHALASLERAKEIYDKHQSYENFERLRDAQREYDRTPGGQRVLQEKIAQATMPDEKYLLEERRRYGLESRKKALDEISAQDKGDIGHEQDKGDIGHEQADAEVKTTSTRLSRVLDVPPRAAMQLSTSYTGYDYDYYGGQCNCPPDDYCRCAQFEGLRVADDATVRSVLADLLHVREDDDELDEWEDWAVMEGYTPETMTEIDVWGGYYGEEAQVYFESSFVNAVRKRYFAQPNAADDLGYLEMARKNGVKTAGMEPQDALFAGLKTVLPGLSKRAFDAAIIKTDGYVEFSKITDTRSPKKQLAVIERGLQARPVLIRNPQTDEYTVIGGKGIVEATKRNARRKHVTAIVIDASSAKLAAWKRTPRKKAATKN